MCTNNDSVFFWWGEEKVWWKISQSPFIWNYHHFFVNLGLTPPHPPIIPLYGAPFPHHLRAVPPPLLLSVRRTGIQLVVDMFDTTWCRNIATQMDFIALCDAQIKRNLSVRGGGKGGSYFFANLTFQAISRGFFFKKSTNTFWCTEISTDTFQWPNFII